MTAFELSNIIEKLIEQEMKREGSPLKDIQIILKGDTNTVCTAIIVKSESEAFTILTVHLPN